jgi:hypothetical protein
MTFCKIKKKDEDLTGVKILFTPYYQFKIKMVLKFLIIFIILY